MARAGGYILKVSNARRKALLVDLADREMFAEAVPTFQHSRNAPLVCFISFESGQFTHIGKARRGVNAGTNLSRLNVTDVVELSYPITFKSIRDILEGSVARHIDIRLKHGGLLPPASFLSLVEALVALSPELGPLLENYSRTRMLRIESLPEQARIILAEQKEAVVTALAIAGIDRRELADWQPPDQIEDSTSYLDGLESVRSLEDVMVITDLNRIPGFEKIRDYTHGSAVFANDVSRLTVTIANHLPLEKQLGVDLIYYNETFQSFVMVQYKAMEQSSSDDEAIFRFPQPQLDKEIKRMDAHLAHIRSAKGGTSLSDYRFFENPFFLKFCPRLNFNPDDIGLVKGMYLSLDYWRLCEKDPALSGPKGGRMLTYRNVGRYLNNTEFVQLVSKAWIGTNAQQSALLIPLVREVIKTGRTVALAIKSDVRDPDDDAAAGEEHFWPSDVNEDDNGAVEIRWDQ